MQRSEIMAAYHFLRVNNHDIPSETLEFIKDAALQVYEQLMDNCNMCAHDGKQKIYPGPCTGCGADGEKRNFKLVGSF